MRRYGVLSGILSLTFITLLVCATLSIAQVLPDEYRSIDGSGNNISNPSWGSVGTQLLRIVGEDYADGISEPAGATRNSPREISNMMATQEESFLNSLGASDFIWQWGQFLDHNIDLTTETEEPLLIPVPTGDAFFDPESLGGQTIGFHRSVFDPNTGDSLINPRQQLNEISTFIDASAVYGSDEVRATALRTMDGTGKLKTIRGGKYLPFNKKGLPNAGGPSKKLFLAGDIRVNEQIALTAIHTLFVREHNRLCRKIRYANLGMTGEMIYQQARKIVGAQIQFITYNEFLPLLLGPGAIPMYSGYDDSVNPAIGNEFSGAAYRLGHSMLSPGLLLVNKRRHFLANNWNPFPVNNWRQLPVNQLGHKFVNAFLKKAFFNPRHFDKDRGFKSIPLKDAFFNPRLLRKSGGIDSILRGLATQQSQEVDNKVVDAVRNFLFGNPGEGGFDLASANIQRGRDHGLADYNSIRQAYGLAPLSDFSDIPADSDVQDALSDAYDSVDAIDLWVGGLAENHVNGGFLGETIQAILIDQFTRLRDGDRFWYQNDLFFTGAQLAEIENTTLADIIRRNTKIGNELPDDVFRVQP
jgi:peroxidase